jgi:hypothetical protein
MQTLINDVRDRLEGMNIFKYISEDWGQLDDYSPNPPTKFPTALVDIVDAKTSETSDLIQLIDVTIMVRVAAIRLSPGSQGATAAQRAKFESVFGITTDVHTKLHGWHKAESTYGTLTRVGLRRAKRDDGIREYQLLFRTVLKDISARQATEDLSNQVPEIIKPIITVVDVRSNNENQDPSPPPDPDHGDDGNVNGY